MIEVREKKRSSDPLEEMLKRFKKYFRKNSVIAQDGFQDMVSYIHQDFSECESVKELDEEYEEISTWHITNLCMGLYTELDFTLLAIAIKTEYYIRKKAIHG